MNLEALLAADCFFDVLGSLVIVLDKDATLLLFNSGAEELTGYKADEVIGKNWFDVFISKDIKIAIKNLFAEMMSGRRDYVDQYSNEILTKNGSKVNLQWHSSVLKDAKGEIEGIVASASDITEVTIENNKMKQLEMDTKNSELKFKAINDAAKDPIVMMDSLGNLVSWNKAATSLFGFTEEEVLGKNLHHIIVTKKEHEKPDRIIRFGQTGASDVLGKTIELPVKNKKGEVIQIELSVTSVKLFGDWHAVGIMRDIRAKKAAETTIAEKMNQLEKMNDLMVGRELKMIELKKENSRLLEEKNVKKK